MFLLLWIMNTVSSFVYELLLIRLPPQDSCWNKCIYTLSNCIIAPLFFVLICFIESKLVWGRARNKTTHFGSMFFISTKQMFILPAFCRDSWINMAFVSEVNKTTMRRLNREDGEAAEMRFGSLWTSGHAAARSTGDKQRDLTFSEGIIYCLIGIRFAVKKGMTVTAL